jgi:hypothetical protein
MSKTVTLSWASFLGVVALLVGLVVLVSATPAQTAESATAAPNGPISREQAVQVNEKTERLHAMHARAVEKEDQEALPQGASQAPLSPEQAIGVIQHSGLGIGQLSSIDSTADASGRQMYKVHTGDRGGDVILVDAITGKIVSPGPTKP